MPAGTFVNYNNFFAKTWDGTLQLNQLATRSYKLALFTSASNAADLTVNTFSLLTNELAAQNGYTAGGFALAGVTSSASGARNFVLRANNIQIQATGGNLVFRHAVVYDTASGILVAVAPVNFVSGSALDLTITANNFWIADLSTSPNGFINYGAPVSV
jgi:hypothetical protein